MTTAAFKAKLQDRLEAKSIPIPHCGCWIWISEMSSSGYGRLRIANSSRSAHRVAWEAYRGSIPHGMHVLHTCDIPSCINPDHLWLGTHAENMRDMSQKQRCGNQRGELNNNTKLTSEQVLLIRSDPRSQRVIALVYNVSKSSISDIKSHRRWGHL